MTSDNATEAETVTVEAVEPQQANAVDGRLIDELVGRAQVDGLRLTGEGGLLQHLTKRLLDSVLQGEIADHLVGVHQDNESDDASWRAGVVDFVGRRQELATLERELQKVAAGVGGERPGRCVMS